MKRINQNEQNEELGSRALSKLQTVYCSGRFALRAALIAGLKSIAITMLVAGLVACCPSALFGDIYQAWANVVYISGNGTNELLVTGTNATGAWCPAGAIPGQYSALPPAVTYFGDRLEFVVAYVANNGTKDLLVTTTDYNGNWNPSTPAGQTSSVSPALTVFGNELVMAYVTGAAHNLAVATSTDAVHWTPHILTGQFTEVTPALTTFGNQLVLAYVSTNGKNELLVTTSTNGVNWTTNTPVAGQYSELAPALTAFNNELVMAYVASNDSRELLVTTSTNTVNWTTSTPVAGQYSPAAPALAVIPNPTSSSGPFTTFDLMMVYVSNSGSHLLLVTTSADGVHWTPTTEVGGQSSLVTPALVITESFNTQ